EVIRILNLRFIVYFVFALVLLGIGFMCGSFYQHIEKTQTISMMDATSEICSTNIEKQRLFALRRLIWTINDYKTTHTDLDTSFSDDFFVDKLVTSMEEVVSTQEFTEEGYAFSESTSIVFADAKKLLEELGGEYPYDI
ncbi:MAG: hypothetical protein ACPH3C_05070, partial [Glaciecola sp.]